MLDDAIYETRVLPIDERLIAEARSNPSGWVYDIDFDYTPDEAVPPEAIRGAWEVSDLGMLSGRYRKNERYRPVVECDRVLKPYVHAAAKHSPGKWISEIDPRGEDSFPDIPEEFICGWWLIGKDGIVTRNFRQNSFFKYDVEPEARNNIFV